MCSGSSGRFASANSSYRPIADPCSPKSRYFPGALVRHIDVVILIWASIYAEHHLCR